MLKSNFMVSDHLCNLVALTIYITIGQSYIDLIMWQLPWQVNHLRGICQLPTDLVALHHDSWGLKKLFTYGVRKSGADNLASRSPNRRESYLWPALGLRKGFMFQNFGKLEWMILHSARFCSDWYIYIISIYIIIHDIYIINDIYINTMTCSFQSETPSIQT